MDWGDRVTYFAETAFQNAVTPFGLKDGDRLEHLFVLGKPGSGRASLLTNIALQDIERGMTVVILDASGTLSSLVLERLSLDAQEKVVYLDPSDGEHPFSWNPVGEFRALGPEALPALTEALASVYHVHPGRLAALAAEAILRHPGSTFLLLYDLVTDPRAREEAFEAPGRKQFEDALALERDAASFIAEHGRYLTKDPLVRNLLGQPSSKFSLKEGAVIVVDVSRIRMFPTRIGPLTRIFAHAAHARGIAGDRVSLLLYECVRHISEADLEYLFPGRKVACVIAASPQTEEDRSVREKALRLSGSVVSFAPHPLDTSLIESAFYPYISPEEISGFKEDELAVALTIDSVRARPFFARALPKPKRTGISHQDIHVVSRERYTIPRLKADQIFMRPSPEPGKENGNAKEPGSFSDAFRSIFAKRADGPGAPASEQSSDPEKKPSEPSNSAPGTVRGSIPLKNSPRKELSEDELRHMLHVKAIGE